MKLTGKIIFITSRNATLELENYGKYDAKSPYDIYLNGTKWGASGKVVQPLYGLTPDTEYRLELVCGGETSEAILFKTDYEFVTLNVRRFNAVGDGVHDDTAAIQAAVMACPPQGRVYLPKGTYRVTSIFLKSNLVIDIDREAIVVGTLERKDIAVLPGMTQSYDEQSDYNLGSWEGNPLDIFASMFTGIGVENVVITGGGTLDGRADFDNWWEDDRAKIIAYRPRMIFLNHCKNVTVEGLTIQNSPSWNLHPYFSKGIRFIGLTILNPWNSPNTDGMDPESVDGLDIIGIHYSLGDDCIALKSGKFYMGNKYKTPCQNIEIRHCLMENGHGAVSIGSEMAGGVKHVHATDCQFKNTDRGLRIKTRRGRGRDAVVEDICFENIEMDNVKTPFVVNSFYNCCDPDAHSDYVKCKEPLPVDDRTPAVNQLAFRGIRCHNTHVAAAFIYGLPEQKIDSVEFTDVSVDYAEHPVPMEPAMMDDIREDITNMGLYINNVKRLELNRVTVEGQSGEKLDIHNIDELLIDGEATNSFIYKEDL